MKYDVKRITSRTLLIYAAVNIFTYLFAHAAYLFSGEIIGDVFAYASYYLTKSVEFLAPPIIAAIAFPILRTHGNGALVTFSLSVASARILYALPYYYLIFIYSYGYDSIESVTLSLLASIAVILLTALGTVASVGIYYLLLKRNAKQNGTSIEDSLPPIYTKTLITDFLASENTPVLTFALVRFFYSLALEIFDTVSFFIEYRSDFRAFEIVTILVNFTLLLVLLVVAYLLASQIKSKLVTDDSEQ